MTTCDFEVSVRIIAADGTTEVFDFNDRVGGFTVETVQIPDEESEKTRVTADLVDGEYTVRERDAAGDLVLLVRVEGSSWAEVTSRWQAARAAYRAEPRFYLEVEIEGVTTLYRTERPDNVQGGSLESVNLVRRRQTYQLRFRVQPNPTVTIDEEA